MSKKNYILSGILLVLALAAYLYKVPMNNWQKEKELKKNFLMAIDMNAVNGLEIVKASTTVAIEKSGDKWQIKDSKGFPVDESSGPILEKLEAIKKADVELISERAEKKKDFQTAKETGVLIRLKKDGATMSEFVVGKYGNDYASTYLSLLDSKETWLFKVSGINMVFDRPDKNSWFDKKIFALDKTKINKVRLQYPDTELIVEKKDDKWSLVKPSAMAVGDGKLDKVLETMAMLSAVDIPAQKFDSTGLEKSSVIVQVTGDGLDETIMIANDNKKDQFYAKKGSSDNIYLINKEQRNTLKVKVSDLK